MSNQYYHIKPKEHTLNIASHLVSISFSKYGQDWKSILHTHPFTELLFIVNGQGNFAFQQESYPLHAGDFVLIPPYIEHTEYSSESAPLEYYVLGIDGISFLEENNTSTPIVCNLKDDPSFFELLKQMLSEIRSEQYGSEEICQHLLEILLLKIIRFRHLIPVPIYTLRMTKECARIKEYLDTNYAEHITLDTLSAMTYTNKYYLLHSFTKFTGLSPIQYLNNQRLKIACNLLESSDYSIATISSMTGFSSQSYFTQAFRKKYQMTPVHYRKLHTTDTNTICK